MRLEERRTRAGYTRTQLAIKAGVDRSLIQMIESGKRKSFREDTMKKIADALGVTQDDVDEFAPLMTGKIVAARPTIGAATLDGKEVAQTNPVPDHSLA